MNFGSTAKRIVTGPLDHYFKFIIVFLLFLLLAFDQDLAMIYLLIMFGDWVWYKSDNFISFPITNKKSKSLTVYIESLAALGFFLVFSTILVSSFSPQTITSDSTIIESAQSIFHLLATSTPILKGSKILTFLGWAVLIPIIETSFFNGRLLEGLTTYAEGVVGHKISLQKMSFNLFVVMLVVASAFALFHITAKGIATIPLLITFTFSVISSMLVVRHQETRGAILMHIVTNGAAVLSSFGVI